MGLQKIYFPIVQWIQFSRLEDRSSPGDSIPYALENTRGTRVIFRQIGDFREFGKLAEGVGFEPTDPT